MKVNGTSPGRFVLLGLSDVPFLQVLFFLVFFMMYMITLSANLLLITVVRMNPKLQTPMYFFLTNLSTIDIGFSSTIVPKLLINTLSSDRSVSMVECALQMYFHLALGSTECVLLAVMSYDRFAAICRPLHYNSIMNRKICIHLALASWSVSFMNSIIHVVLIFQIPNCKTYQVHHFLCELPPFLRTSCRDTFLNEVAMYIGAGFIVLCSFFLTLISYVCIISAMLKIRSSQGRRKTFSTCGSHLSVVILYYGTILFVYLRPHSTSSSDTDNIFSIFYTAVTPMLNPIIYSMRNQDVKDTIGQTKR